LAAGRRGIFESLIWRRRRSGERAGIAAVNRQELESPPINKLESTEHAKVFQDIASLLECSYRSGRGRADRARQNPVARKYPDLRFDLGRGPGDGHVLQAGVGPVEEINRICRRTAVERQAGGKNGGGAILTPFGLSLVARYRKIERSAESAARKELLALRADIGARRKA
jgi:hypothetical protein